MTIDESNICCHYSEIWLDDQFGVKNPQFKNSALVAIMAKVKPTGVKADALKSALENPKENCAFSIRAFTNDYTERGIHKRVLAHIVTFDHVNEPGISIANKYDAPGLECLEEQSITDADIDNILNVTANNNISLENITFLKELKNATKFKLTTLPSISIPKYLNW